MLGNTVDDRHHSGDLLAVVGQLADHLGGLLHAAGQASNRFLDPADHLLALAGQGVGSLRQVAGGAGMLSDVVHGGRHLVDGGGGLVGLALLAEHAVLHLAHSRGQLCGAMVQLRRRMRYGADDPLITGLQGIEGTGHLPDFVAAGCRGTG
ncbi:hypothetical protein D9M71_143070 [compost metagenome]